MERRKARKGFSLIELLIAIVVLAILGAITLVAGSSAQKRARITSAMTVFDNYKAAFDTAVMDHPGLVNDRLDNWVWKDESVSPAVERPYNTVQAYKRLVGLMNKSLSDELKFVPSADGRYYESVGTDPWGGKYVLLEYPVVGDVSYFDPTQANSQASLRFSIWCTGLDSDIIKPDAASAPSTTDPALSAEALARIVGWVRVRDYSVGITLNDTAGNFSYVTHGSNDGPYPYTDAYIPIS